MTTDTKASFGQSVLRREDPLLLMGRGTFCDDIKLPGMGFAAVLRSPHGHALLKEIDTTEALAAPGVRLVLTGADTRDHMNSIRPNWLVGDVAVPDRPVLAHSVVRFVGDPVAFIVADSRAEALDAIELIDVEYEPLDAVVDEVAASDGPQLHDNVPGNQVALYALSNGDYDAVAATAHRIIKHSVVNNRLIPSPLEPRTIVAEYDRYSGHATVHLPSQVPHLHRRWIAETLGWSENKLRIHAPHIGGGFGSKMHLYPEELLVPYAARLLGAPVKWTETRSESHMSTTHGRAHTEFAEAAVDKDGRILALKVDSYANMGAYLSNMATGIPTINSANFMTGCYDIPVGKVTTHLMVTNTVPVDAYRGAGRPEAAYLIERTLDRIADELGLDPVDVRMRNLIRAEQFPYNPFDHPILSFDSGNYDKTLAKAVELIGYEAWRAKQEAARKEGKYLGIGITNYNEACGVGPSYRLGLAGFNRGGYESVQIRVHSDGKISVFTGSMPQGHGHETSYSQIVSRAMDLPMDMIDVVVGDTDRIPAGVGTYNSRSMPVGGSAAHNCALSIMAKAKAIAAECLGLDLDDISYENGVFFETDDPDESMSFAEVARMAYNGHIQPEGHTPGLDEVLFYDPINFSAPNGSHAAIVEVDIETGKITLLDYAAVDDIGVVINPMTAEGQVHGGVVQGIGQAMFEGAVYDEDGQLLSGSLLDYALPKADQLPSLQTAFLETPATTNPLGIKGVGEAGTCAAPPAIVAAVCDALKPFGIAHIDMPLTPPKVWRAIQTASASTQKTEAA